MTSQSLAAAGTVFTRTPQALSATLHDSVADFAAWWAAARPQACLLPFQDPRVMAVWERTIGAGSGARCHVVRLDLNGAPLLAIYFALRPLNRRGLRLLTFMDGGVSDYNAPILFEPLPNALPPANRLWRHIFAALPRHDRIELEKMPATVKHLLNPLWLADGKPHRTAGHVMTLPSAWDELMQEKGKSKIVKAAKRNYRQLNERGAVRLLMAHDLAERDQILDAMLAAKRDQLRRMGVSDIFARPGVEDFYRQCAAIQNPPITRLSGLLVNDEVVATNMGFVDAHHFCGVLTSFSQGPWARYSCGHLHLQMLLRWASESGLRSFDFGIGDEDYKKFWCDRDIALRDMQGPVSVAGRAHDLFYSLRGHARGAFRHVCLPGRTGAKCRADRSSGTARNGAA